MISLFLPSMAVYQVSLIEGCFNQEFIPSQPEVSSIKIKGVSIEE